MVHWDGWRNKGRTEPSDSVVKKRERGQYPHSCVFFEYQARKERWKALFRREINRDPAQPVRLAAALTGYYSQTSA